VVVESQTETNSISFPFENTVHDNIYAVINWLASCFCFTTGHFYAISGTYLVSLSVARRLHNNSLSLQWQQIKGLRVFQEIDQRWNSNNFETNCSMK
jgi:hypothetical protein